jgi:periplasmic protein CpxP/Spy
MKKMIRIISIAFFLVCAIASYAQDSSMAMAKRSPEQLAQMQTMQFKKKLSLTAEQEAKVTPILSDYYKKMMAVKGDKGRKMKKMQEAKHHTGEKDKAMKAILTEQQYTDYQKLMEEQKEKMAEKKGGK